MERVDIAGVQRKRLFIKAFCFTETPRAMKLKGVTNYLILHEFYILVGWRTS